MGTARFERASAELDRDLRRRGAIILSLFALIWAIGVPGVESMVGTLAVIVMSLAITGGTVLMALRGDPSRTTSRSRLVPSDWQRRYNLVGLAEAVTIGLAIAVLVLMGLPVLIPPAVCLVVGIHFFPLARIFDQPQYWWTGVGLCIIAVLGVTTMALGSDDASRAVVGYGAAAILWATSVHLAFSG